MQNGDDLNSRIQNTIKDAVRKFQDAAPANLSIENGVRLGHPADLFERPIDFGNEPQAKSRLPLIPITGCLNVLLRRRAKGNGQAHP